MGNQNGNDPKIEKPENSGQTSFLVPYSSTLFKSESGQIPNESLMKMKQVTDELKANIENIIKLTKTESEATAVMPSTLVKRLNEELKAKLTNELTVYEIQAITALVVLIHKASLNNELSYFAQTEEAYVEFTLNEFYEAIGLVKDAQGKFSNKTQKEYALKALLNLHYKHFFVPFETKKSIRIRTSNIVRIHEIEILKKQIEREKGTTIKVTVSSLFFEFDSPNKDHKRFYNDHYFEVPSNLNTRIRELSSSRLPAGSVMLVKAIYHNRHFALRNGNKTIEFSQDKLVDIMSLHKHIERRQMRRAESAIDKGMELARKLHLINNVEKGLTKTGRPKYILSLSEIDSENQLELKM